MKAKAKKRVKTLWNKKSRRGVSASRKTTKLIGRQTGGQWVERRSPGGGLKID